jgi:polyisoprenoid-binding protein YceI
MTELQTERGEVVRVPTGTWKADPAHSSVGFEVKHMMIATVRGTFRAFDGTLEAAEDPADSRAWGTVDAASVDTGSPERDEHLRGPDFFDAEHYPQIRFESTRIEPLGGPSWRVVGELTIKDVTREVAFDATVQGAGEDPWGNERVGIAVRGTINRTDFGLTWQQRLARGGLLVGEDVAVMIDVSAIRAGAAEQAA